MFKFIKNLIKYTVRLVFIAALLGTVYLFWPELCTLAGQPYQGDDGLRDKIKKDLVSMFDNFDVVMDPIADFFRPAPKTIQEAFLQRDPINCARYYANVRRDSVNADEVFIEEIIPMLADCDYSEIITIYDILRGTPAMDYMTPVYLLARDNYIVEMVENFDEYAKFTKAQFSNDVIPIIQQEVNDSIAVDFERVLEDYCGVGGFKIINDADDLVKSWRKFVGNQYTAMINRLTTEYTDNTTEFYNDYLNMVGINYNNKFNTNDFKLIAPQEVIASYTEKQNKEMLKDIAIDGGLTLLSIVTAGGAAPLQIAIKIADGAYTGYQIYSEFTNEEPTEEEKLYLAIAQMVSVQVEDYLSRKYNNFIDTENKFVQEKILNRMIQIENDLNIENNIEPMSFKKDEIMRTINQK